MKEAVLAMVQQLETCISREMYPLESLTIGQLAQLCGVSAKAIRYYESIGLLPPAQRSENGYRYYNQGDVNRLVVLRRLRLLGISLEMLKPFLTEAPDALCIDVQQEVLRLIEDRMVAIDQEMRELQRLREHVQDYHQQLLTCHPGTRETFHDCCDLSCLALPDEIPLKE